MNAQHNELGERAINLIGLIVETAAEDEAVVMALAKAGLEDIYIAMVELYDERTEDMLAEPLQEDAEDEEGPPEVAD